MPGPASSGPRTPTGQFTVRVPEERRPQQSRLEVRYSPTLAGAMVDALPYLVDYPYGCTEQTLNRFLPTVITQKILLDMKLNLKEIRKKRTNLNAQEIGDDTERAKQWKRYDAQPGLRRGRGPQDGQGRRRAADRDAAFRRRLGLVLRLGRAFLGRTPRPWWSTACKWPGRTTWPWCPACSSAASSGCRRYQDEQIQLDQELRRSRRSAGTAAGRTHADELDAFVYMVLVDAGVKNAEMLDFLYRDRTKIAVYAKAMFGLALEKQGEKEKLAMILQQHQPVRPAGRREPDGLAQPARGLLVVLVRQRVRGRRLLPEAAGADRSQGRAGPAAGQVPAEQPQERHLLELDPRHGDRASRPWPTSCAASGEQRPEMTVEVFYDGKLQKAVEITPQTLFTFDNKFVLEGEAVTAGKHTGRSSRRRAPARSTTTAT